MKYRNDSCGQKTIKRVVQLVLMCLCFCALSGCRREVKVPVYDDTPDPVHEERLLAIVGNIDEVNGKIILRPVERQSEIMISYNGGADVQDAYGEIYSIKQVEPGTVADVVYDSNAEKLLSLHICGGDKVKRLEHQTGAVINILENYLRVNGETYTMSDSAVAFSDNKEILMNEILPQDQISIWMYNDVVCSVNVELGHGYLKLADYASYLGGTVEVGSDVIVPVTQDMLLTVREGDYTLRIYKDEDIGTKNVKIVRNQEITLSLADIAIEPKQIGSVMFKVKPDGARVYVDGKLMNTEGAVELVYGKHHLQIEADGYETYTADFDVKYAYKIKEYQLTPENGATTTQKNTSSSSKTTSGQTTNKNTTEKTTEKTTDQSSSSEKKTDNTADSSTTEKSTETEDKPTSQNDVTKNKVIISAPLGASVFLDGEYIGIAPISFTKVTGSHIITLSQSGCLSKSYTEIFVDDGKDTTLTYDALTTIASLIE